MSFVKGRLGVMMFLQYAVWGVWLTILPGYLTAEVTPDGFGGLGFSAAQMGIILGVAASVGALSAPFISGQIADRFFSAEKFLAFLLFAGGIVIFIMSTQTTFKMWLFLSILYSVLYMPTLTLTNSLAFSHLKDPDTEFSRVRVWGTFGWIAAGWIFSWVFLMSDLKLTGLPPFLVGDEHAKGISQVAYALKVSGVLSMLYAGYCFFLPHTPPKKEVESIAWKETIAFMKKPSVIWLFVAAIMISTIHNVYFMQAFTFLTDGIGMKTSSGGPAMTVGQIGEIFVMAILGTIILKLGIRGTLVLGGCSYVLRFAIWAVVGMGDVLGDAGVVIAVVSQALHGVSFACFYVCAFIYIDRIAPKDIRHSAQAMFGISLVGFGPMLSGPVLGQLSKTFGDGAVITNFAGMWATLSVIALIATTILFTLFRDESGTGDGNDVDAGAA
ncbi:MAG: MFS transporter [Candidatus Hydrogenedentota bacterium]